MCGKNFTFLCCGVLFVLWSSKSQQNTINNEERDDNLTVRNEIDMDFTNYSDELKTLRYDLYEKFTNNTQYNEMQYEFRTISTNNSRKNVDTIQYKQSRRSVQNHENDEQILMESHTNSTNVNHKRNFTSQEFYEDLIEKNNSMPSEVFENSNKDSNKSNVVPYETCHNIICIQLCCPLGYRMRMDNEECIFEEIEYIFPNMYGYTNDSMLSENKRVDELFQLTVYDSCQGKVRVLLPEKYQYDFIIFANGSIYLPYVKIFTTSTSYCLAIIEGGNKFEVTYCPELEDVNKLLMPSTDNTALSFDSEIIHVIFRIGSILFLVIIFLVYSILPELRNVHGFMLRNYSGALSIAYTFDIVNIITKADDIQYPVCIAIGTVYLNHITPYMQTMQRIYLLAFFEYFCYLSGFFWLIIISFDMWWTFRGFCSLQKNTRQQEKRKLVFYASFAWGCPLLLAVVCVIMDSVSEYVPKILRPEFRLGDCWFHEKETFALYYYGIKSVCIISSVYLSISAAFKIARYEKDTSLRLTDSESKRYNDNKKWLNLYLKLFIVLFIVMGIKWSVMTVTWLTKNVSDYAWYVTNLVDILQNLCTFTIFVWKKKIKLMLLKRFGCETKATSSTCPPTSGMPIQEKISSCREENCHLKNSYDGTYL